MSNQIQEAINVDTHNPVRNFGIPQNPVPQTNTGLLEHSANPFEPQEQITDIPIDFSWMTTQYKYIGSFGIDTTSDVGTALFVAPVLSHPISMMPTYDLPNWYKLPFATSIWWSGCVSFRFTIIKPPRVVGKLLVRYRQDEFGDYSDSLSDIPYTADATYRSILKEWDLAESNQFEFDVTGSLPIRARPSKFDWNDSSAVPEITYRDNCFAAGITPWLLNHMGGIRIEIAQKVAPGGIFPDKYTILVEKAFKDATFMTPLDSKKFLTDVIKNPSYEP